MIELWQNTTPLTRQKRIPIATVRSPTATVPWLPLASFCNMSNSCETLRTLCSVCASLAQSSREPADVNLQRQENTAMCGHLQSAAKPTVLAASYIWVKVSAARLQAPAPLFLHLAAWSDDTPWKLQREEIQSRSTEILRIVSRRCALTGRRQGTKGTRKCTWCPALVQRADGTWGNIEYKPGVCIVVLSRAAWPPCQTRVNCTHVSWSRPPASWQQPAVPLHCLSWCCDSCHTHCDMVPSCPRVPLCKPAGCQTAEEPTGRQCPEEELTWAKQVHAKLYLLTIRAGPTSPTRRRRPFAKAWSEAEESNSSFRTENQCVAKGKSKHRRKVFIDRDCLACQPSCWYTSHVVAIGGSSGKNKLSACVTCPPEVQVPSVHAEVRVSGRWLRWFSQPQDNNQHCSIWNSGFSWRNGIFFQLFTFECLRLKHQDCKDPVHKFCPPRVSQHARCNALQYGCNVQCGTAPLSVSSGSTHPWQTATVAKHTGLQHLLRV